jgi:leucyl-tRNA---protein transferase
VPPILRRRTLHTFFTRDALDFRLMSLLNDLPLTRIQFYSTAPYPCSYLPNRFSRSQVATPSHMVNSYVYTELVRMGFRRSGAFVYRPHCEGCNACTPVRIPTAQFSPSRTQRKTWKRHANLTVTSLPMTFQREHYMLYLEYQKSRHPGGGMDQDSHEQYRHFLLHSGVDSELIEFREDGALRMVSIIDRLRDGLSSVYTFYNPTVENSSYGTYNILWQIEAAKRLNLPHVYLGYWIEDSPKMHYKLNFRPIEALIDGRWSALP